MLSGCTTAVCSHGEVRTGPWPAASPSFLCHLLLQTEGWVFAGAWLCQPRSSPQVPVLGLG